MSRPVEFQRFAERKMREAEHAVIPPLKTMEDCTSRFRLCPIGNTWTRQHYDGDFVLFDPPRDLPAVSLVFVQSSDRNTVAANPASLGGGATDMHLVYEGLSRVAADAVLAGAATVGRHVFFSVWHPEIVSLRRDLKLPRHPAQVVMSREGRINFDARLFNVPDVPVFLLIEATALHRCERALADRPWITAVPIGKDGLIDAFRRLWHEHEVSRISVVGGRTVATALVDAGLIQDLCLTTSSVEGGTPNTPFYDGHHRPELDLIVRKRGAGESGAIVFEHFAVRGT